MIRIDGKGKGNSRRGGMVRLPSESSAGKEDSGWMTDADRAKYGLPAGSVRIQDEIPQKGSEKINTDKRKRLSDVEKDALYADLVSGHFTNSQLSFKYSVVPSVISYHAARLKAESEPLADSAVAADVAAAVREVPIETPPETLEDEEEELWDSDPYGLLEPRTGMPVDLCTLKEDLEAELAVAQKRLAAINLIMSWHGAREAEWAQERETSNDW